MDSASRSNFSERLDVTIKIGNKTETKKVETYGGSTFSLGKMKSVIGGKYSPFSKMLKVDGPGGEVRYVKLKDLAPTPNEYKEFRTNADQIVATFQRSNAEDGSSSHTDSSSSSSSSSSTLEEENESIQPQQQQQQESIQPQQQQQESIQQQQEQQQPIQQQQQQEPKPPLGKQGSTGMLGKLFSTSKAASASEPISSENKRKKKELEKLLDAQLKECKIFLESERIHKGRGKPIDAKPFTDAIAAFQEKVDELRTGEDVDSQLYDIIDDIQSKLREEMGKLTASYSSDE